MNDWPPLVCPSCGAVLDEDGREVDVERCATCGAGFPLLHGVRLLSTTRGDPDVEEAQRAIYDAFPHRDYRGWRLGCGPDLTLTYWSHCRRIRALRAARGAVLLDVGCIDGRRLHEIATSFEVFGIGIDTSPVAIGAARRQKQPRARFHAASAQALPLPDASVDVAICLDVLEHTADPSRVIQEVRRCLKPGGRFLAHVPVADHAGSLDACMAASEPAAWRQRLREVGHDYDRMPTSRALSGWFLAAGFENVRLERFNAWHQNRFDYHSVHRVLNTLFFAWKLPLPLYHCGLIHATRIWYYLDRPRLRRGIGASVYVSGDVPR